MNTIEELYTEISAELTVMSPIFIGSGEELNKTKYYFNQSDMTVKIVDEKKFRQFLAKRNLFESFQSHLLQCNDRGRNIGNLSRWLKENNLMPDGIDIWKYTLKAKNIRKKDEKRDKSIQLNDIKAFIKNANGKPYIPGSSLKGAIRMVGFNNIQILSQGELQIKYESVLSSIKPKDILHDLSFFKDITKYFGKIMSFLFGK